MRLKIDYSTLDLCEPLLSGFEKAFDGIRVNRVCGVVCCGTSDDVEYHHLLKKIKSAIYNIVGKDLPVTLIPQYLLPNGGLSIEIYSLDNEADIRIEEREGVCYGTIESKNEKMLFVEGIPAMNFSDSVRQQSGEVFGKLESLLSSHGFEVDDIVRQWNYIGSIVASREGKQNYQEFNDARTHYYASGKWENGYPAATGIGAAGEGIIVGGIAFKKIGTEIGGIYPIDNPLQVAAHVYSKSVLIDDGADAMKSTPKFERAKVVETERGVCCFVSGTAAIRGEESVDASSPKMQTIKTIENIEHLVSKENLEKFGCKPYDLKYVKLHVFIKNEKDYEEVRAVVEKAYPQVPTIYSIADVCRSELLVEIEGILIS